MFRSRFFLVVAVAALNGSAAFGKCFEFVNLQPTEVGPAALFGPASRICVVAMRYTNGKRFWYIDFHDRQGELARMMSRTESPGRCTEFCRTYTLVSGTAHGKKIQPDWTKVVFEVEGVSGTVKISHPRSGDQTFDVIEADG